MFMKINGVTEDEVEEQAERLPLPCGLRGLLSSIWHEPQTSKTGLRLLDVPSLLDW